MTNKKKTLSFKTENARYVTRMTEALEHLRNRSEQTHNINPTNSSTYLRDLITVHHKEVGSVSHVVELFEVLIFVAPHHTLVHKRYHVRVNRPDSAFVAEMALSKARLEYMLRQSHQNSKSIKALSERWIGNIAMGQQLKTDLQPDDKTTQVFTDDQGISSKKFEFSHHAIPSDNRAVYDLVCAVKHNQFDFIEGDLSLINVNDRANTVTSEIGEMFPCLHTDIVIAIDRGVYTAFENAQKPIAGVEFRLIRGSGNELNQSSEYNLNGYHRDNAVTTDRMNARFDVLKAALKTSQKLASAQNIKEQAKALLGTLPTNQTRFHSAKRRQLTYPASCFGIQIKRQKGSL